MIGSLQFSDNLQDWLCSSLKHALPTDLFDVHRTKRNSGCLDDIVHMAFECNVSQQRLSSQAYVLGHVTLETSLQAVLEPGVRTG